MSCPFCHPAPNQVFLETELVLGLRDRYPVSPGHALLFEIDSSRRRRSGSRPHLTCQTGPLIQPMYAGILADRLGIEIGPAVAKKMKLNAEKYPADLARGSALKYSKLP